jgi:hypothetical protein
MAVICDVQQDFCTGVMATTGYDIMMKNLKTLVAFKDIDIIYTAFSHPEDHDSFRISGGLWEPNCIKGTKGEEILKNAYRKGSEILVKGRDKADIELTAEIEVSEDTNVILVCGVNLEGVISEQAIRIKNKYPKKSVYIIDDCSIFENEDDWSNKSISDDIIDNNIKIINVSDIQYLLVTPIKDDDQYTDEKVCKRCSPRLYNLLKSFGVYKEIA